jgi:hypothetical protein
MNTDTPLPQEEPAGQNPPDGAIIDYYLNNDANSEVTLEISDAKGNLVRKFSSNDTLYQIPPVNIPLYWIRPQQTLSAHKGGHRLVWDLHYTPINEPPSYPMTAVYKNTPPNYTSLWIMPGTYMVKLKANGQTYSQPLTVVMDPRVKTPINGLQLQHDLSLECYNARQQVLKVLDEMNSAKQYLKSQSQGEAIANLQSTQRGSKEKGFEQLNGTLASLLNLLQDNDMMPTTQAIKATKETLAQYKDLMNRWQVLKKNLQP